MFINKINKLIRINPHCQFALVSSSNLRYAGFSSISQQWISSATDKHAAKDKDKVRTKTTRNAKNVLQEMLNSGWNNRMASDSEQNVRADRLAKDLSPEELEQASDTMLQHQDEPKPKRKTKNKDKS